MKRLEAKALQRWHKHLSVYTREVGWNLGKTESAMPFCFSKWGPEGVPDSFEG
jgi:hypothetical protein